MGTTCLSWSSDGELRSADRQFVLERLSHLDTAAAPELRRACERSSGFWSAEEQPA